MDVTVQQLRCFVAVAEELHFTRAAQRLRIAAPSLSQQITELEKRLRVALFHRTSRSVRLTDAGGELLPMARRAVGAVDEIKDWAQQRRGEGERLRIGTVVAGGRAGAIFAAAAERFPEVRWEIRRFGCTGCFEALRAGEVDVAFVVQVRPPAVTGISAVELWREGRVLVVDDAHRLAGRDRVSIEETNDENFLRSADRPEDSGWFVDPRPSGARPRMDQVVRTFEEVLELCAAGFGVNIAGGSAAGSHPRPGLSYVPIWDVPGVTTYLCMRTGTAPPLLRAFRQLAMRVAAER